VRLYDKSEERVCTEKVEDVSVIKRREREGA